MLCVRKTLNGSHQIPFGDEHNIIVVVSEQDIAIAKLLAGCGGYGVRAVPEDDMELVLAWFRHLATLSEPARRVQTGTPGHGNSRSIGKDVDAIPNSIIGVIRNVPSTSTTLNHSIPTRTAALNRLTSERRRPARGPSIETMLKQLARDTP